MQNSNSESMDPETTEKLLSKSSKLVDNDLMQTYLKKMNLDKTSVKIKHEKKLEINNSPSVTKFVRPNTSLSPGSKENNMIRLQSYQSNLLKKNKMPMALSKNDSGTRFQNLVSNNELSDKNSFIIKKNDPNRVSCDNFFLKKKAQNVTDETGYINQS